MPSWVGSMVVVDGRYDLRSEGSGELKAETARKPTLTTAEREQEMYRYAVGVTYAIVRTTAPGA